MKFAPMAAPVLAVAMIPVVTDSATAYALEGQPIEGVKADLRVAICAQDWDKAAELSSNLIASPTITPEHRQDLVSWRHRFSDYSKSQIKFDSVPNCEGVQIKVQPYEAPAPRFSSAATVASSSPCYMKMRGVVTDLSHMCGSGGVDLAANSQQLATNANLSDILTFGVRADGNTVKGSIWNSGLTPASNVKITLRAQQTGRSEEFREVVIDRVGARGEADFVAEFNHLPQNWSIESIEVN